MSWGKKNISVFLSVGGFSKTYSGLPTECSITKTGGLGGQAIVKIYGMSISDMDRLTIVPFNYPVQMDGRVEVKASYKGGMSMAFVGDIRTAWADFSGSPETAFVVNADMTARLSTVSESPMSFKQGEVTSAEIMAMLAKNNGLNFKNEGVTGATNAITVSGDPLYKMHKIGEANGFNFSIDNDTLTIFPKDGDTGGIAFVNSDDDMLGYPQFTLRGIQGRCLFNPLMEVGGTVTINSVIPRASGTWRLGLVTHTLTANTTYEGPWETGFEADFMG